MMTELFGDFLPVEIWDLVLDKLDDGKSSGISDSLIDCLYLFSALNSSNVPVSFQYRLKDRWQLLNCCTHKDWPEILNCSPSVTVLASPHNLVLEGSEFSDGVRPVFVVDENTDVEMLNFEGIKEFNIIYCGDSVKIGDFLLGIAQNCRGSLVSLVVDSEPCVDSGKKLFELLNTDLYSLKWCFDRIVVSFPWAKILECNYMALDTFIYQALNCHEWLKSGDALFNQFLQRFKLNFPMLEQIRFVTQTAAKNETCNFIDLSSLVLNKFKDKKIPLMNLFKIHSLENWNLPRITEFSGHRFKFDETAMTGSPERRTISLRENLTLLREMAIDETIDATPYYRLSLLPKGVKHTRIANWIPSQTTPIMILKSKSLESLSLKILTFENAPATVIQGLFLPSLQCLNLEQMEEQQVTPVPPIDRRDSTQFRNRPATTQAEPCANAMSPILFSSWNQLTDLYIIQINMKRNHYVFDIDNLKKSLPSINLKKSFQTFFDEQQRFIVV